MTVVSLTNPGLIPMEAVTTMGVSAKEGDHPIGVFGTGLKYAIASLVRTSQSVTIWCGLDRYDFAAQRRKVRGKSFDFIVMTGPEGAERLGFTTHLGAHWEMWQVFRELYSNCLDEGGEMALEAVEPREGFTTIVVEGVGFTEAARDKDRYFLSTTPLYRGVLADIHPGRSQGIYYRGVLVAKTEHPSAHTYNVTGSLTLTEDRTLKEIYSAKHWIAYTLANCTDPDVLKPALTAQNSFEGSLAYDSPCAAFAETVMALCARLGTAAVLPQAVNSAELWAQKEARGTQIEPSESETEEIEDATAFLADIGYPITAPIVVVETLGPDIFGMARNETIFIAKITLNRGGNFLIGTILEEQLHLTHGFVDESRRFQDFLIDLVVKFAKDSRRKPRRERPVSPAFIPRPAAFAAEMEMPF